MHAVVAGQLVHSWRLLLQVPVEVRLQCQRDVQTTGELIVEQLALVLLGVGHPLHQ